MMAQHTPRSAHATIFGIVWVLLQILLPFVFSLKPSTNVHPPQPHSTMGMQMRTSCNKDKPLKTAVSVTLP
jgi:hypothetical protein